MVGEGRLESFSINFLTNIGIVVARPLHQAVGDLEKVPKEWLMGQDIRASFRGFMLPAKYLC